VIIALIIGRKKNRLCYNSREQSFYSQMQPLEKPGSAPRRFLISRRRLILSLRCNLNGLEVNVTDGPEFAAEAVVHVRQPGKYSRWRAFFDQKPPPRCRSHGAFAGEDRRPGSAPRGVAGAR